MRSLRGRFHRLFASRPVPGLRVAPRKCPFYAVGGCGGGRHGGAPDRTTGGRRARLLDAPPPLRIVDPVGAGERTRTADLLITNQLLYQLSYAGNPLESVTCEDIAKCRQPVLPAKWAATAGTAGADAAGARVTRVVILVVTIPSLYSVAADGREPRRARLTPRPRHAGGGWRRAVRQASERRGSSSSSGPCGGTGPGCRRGRPRRRTATSRRSADLMHR